MAKPEKTTRKPTSAERIAAGVLGREVPAKPKGLSTAQWHVDRFNARDQAAEPELEVEPEEKPLSEWAAKQVRVARNFRTFLAEEMGKGSAGPPDAA